MEEICIYIIYFILKDCYPDHDERSFHEETLEMFHLRSTPHKSPRNPEVESFTKVTLSLFLTGTLWAGGGGALQSLAVCSSSSRSILNLFWPQFDPFDPTPFVTGALLAKDEEDPLASIVVLDEICGDLGKFEDRPLAGERIRFPLLLLNTLIAYFTDITIIKCKKKETVTCFVKYLDG